MLVNIGEAAPSIPLWIFAEVLLHDDRSRLAEVGAEAALEVAIKSNVAVKALVIDGSEKRRRQG